MKKRIPFLLTIGLTFGLAACGPADSSSSSMPPAGTGSPESSEKSSTPSSSPVVKIPKEEFLEAQAKLQSLSGYSYRDSLSVKVDTSLSDQYDPSGVKEGTINFSKTASVTQLAHYQVSGALFFDGESYEIVQDKTKRTVDLNEDGSLKKVNEEAVEGADIPVLAKALFEYDEADIKAVVEKDGRYELTTTASASSVIEDAIDFLDSGLVRQLIGTDYPSLTPEYSLSVEIEDEMIKSYDYSFDLTVLGQTLSLDYAIEFISYQDVAPVLPSGIPGISLSDEDMAACLTEVNSLLSAYRSLPRSGYAYKAKMDVDFADGTPLLTDVSTTVKGETVRVVEQGVAYYQNEVEMDTNLPDYDSEDYTRYRVKSLDGKVYDVEKRLLGDRISEVTEPDQGDDFYFLTASFAVDEVIYCLEDTEKGSLTLLLNKQGVEKMISFLEDATRLDVTLAKHDSPFGDWDNLDYDAATVEFVSVDEALSQLTVELEGEFRTTVPNYEHSGEASYQASLEITIDNSLAASYQAPATGEDIDL